MDEACSRVYSHLVRQFVESAIRTVHRLRMGCCASDRAAHADGSETLFSEMVSEDEKAQPIPDSVIVSEASALIIAGTDTTAMALTYLTYEGLSNETVKRRLVAQLCKLSKNPRWAGLEDCLYLNNVIQESLRLHPPAPGGLVRILPNTGARFGKYVMPAGTQLNTQPFTLQRDPNVFEDPLRYALFLYLPPRALLTDGSFNPDRWVDPTPAMREQMMAFGGTARMCLGMNIVRLELLHVVSKLFRECPRISLYPTTTEASMETVDYFAIKPKGGKCLIVPE